jgi:hypothetical protein
LLAALQEIADTLDALDKVNAKQSEVNKELVETVEQLTQQAHRYIITKDEGGPEGVSCTTVIERQDDGTMKVVAINYEHRAEPERGNCAFIGSASPIKGQPADAYESIAEDAKQPKPSADTVVETPMTHTGEEYWRKHYKESATEDDRVEAIIEFRRSAIKAGQERDELKAQVEHYKSYCGSQVLMSDYQTADLMREDLDRLKKENAYLLPMADATAHTITDLTAKLKAAEENVTLITVEREQFHRMYEDASSPKGGKHE